jgi:hypothetical protein
MKKHSWMVGGKKEPDGWMKKCQMVRWLNEKKI